MCNRWGAGLMTYRLLVDVPHEQGRWLRRGRRAVHADDVARLVLGLAPGNRRPSFRQHCGQTDRGMRGMRGKLARALIPRAFCPRAFLNCRNYEACIFLLAWRMERGCGGVRESTARARGVFLRVQCTSNYVQIVCMVACNYVSLYKHTCIEVS